MSRIIVKNLPSGLKEDRLKKLFSEKGTVTDCSLKFTNKGIFRKFAFVGFKDESEAQSAVEHFNRSFIDTAKIEVTLAHDLTGESGSTTNRKNKKSRKELKSKETTKTDAKKKSDSTQTEELPDELIAESSRLYVRNLSYCCKEEDLESLFGKYGPIEVHLPLDRFTKKIKGFAFVNFMIPENAMKSYTELDRSIFQGRMLHIMPGKLKKEDSDISDDSPYWKKKEARLKSNASSSHNWNTLFIGTNAVADIMAKRSEVSKRDLVLNAGKQSVAVRLALGQTQIVAETRDFLIKNGVALDSFSQADGPRSKTVILVKHLPAETARETLQTIFEEHGTITRLVLPPNGVTAIIEFQEPAEARVAFGKLAYTKFNRMPLYLEWAPVNIFNASAPPESTIEKDDAATTDGEEKEKKESSGSSSEDEFEEEPGRTIFVKNIPNEKTDDEIKKIFGRYGEIRSILIKRKKPDQSHSFGDCGFVEFYSSEMAKKALQDLRQIDGQQVELKISDRKTLKSSNKKKTKKRKVGEEKKSTKFLIRNVPFEATVKDIEDLLGSQSGVLSVRLPKKAAGTGTHRGFAFVDFLGKKYAVRAFNRLCHNTSLFGRRLNLEWAKTEESVEEMRKRSAKYYDDGSIGGASGAKKKTKMSNILDDLELQKDDDD